MTNKIITDLGAGNTGKLITRFFPENFLIKDETKMFIHPSMTPDSASEAIEMLNETTLECLTRLSSTTGIKFINDITVDYIPHFLDEGHEKPYKTYNDYYLIGYNLPDNFFNSQNDIKELEKKRHSSGVPNIFFELVSHTSLNSQITEISDTLEHELGHKFSQPGVITYKSITNSGYCYTSEFLADAMHLLIGNKQKSIDLKTSLANLHKSWHNDSKHHPSDGARIYALENEIFLPSLKTNVKKIIEGQNNGDRFDLWQDYIKNEEKYSKLNQEVYNGCKHW